MEFIPDCHHFEDFTHNRRTALLPLYEHIICIPVMEQILSGASVDWRMVISLAGSFFSQIYRVLQAK